MTFEILIIMRNLTRSKQDRSKVVNFTQGALPAWWFSHIGISRTDRYLSQKLRKPQQNLSKIIWHILCLELKLKKVMMQIVKMRPMHRLLKARCLASAVRCLVISIFCSRSWRWLWPLAVAAALRLMMLESDDVADVIQRSQQQRFKRALIALSPLVTRDYEVFPSWERDENSRCWL